MRFGLLLVAGIGILPLVSALIPWPNNWVVSFYIPLGVGAINAMAIWSVILAVVRSRRGLPLRVYQPLTSAALAASITGFFLGRLPAGVPIIMLAAGVVMLSYIFYQARSFLGLDRNPRW